MVVLRNDPLVRESMKYNKLTGRIDIVKKLWWNEEICKLDDDGRTYFYYFFERYYKLTSEKCMDKALRIEANSRAYHPICEYLEQLECKTVALKALFQFFNVHALLLSQLSFVISPKPLP